MRLKNTIKIILLTLSCAAISAHADQTIINNNYGSNNQAPANATPTCAPANQNNIYDPRVPPAGVYQENGSTTYTTGEKKPYIVDNNCNSSSTAPVQPYVFVPPPRR